MIYVRLMQKTMFQHYWNKVIMNMLWAIIASVGLINAAYALSANEIMTQNWQANSLFESQYAAHANVDGNVHHNNASQTTLSNNKKNNLKANEQTNSVTIPGFGTVRDGVFDIKDDTHLIFYTDGVAMKLDY